MVVLGIDPGCTVTAFGVVRSRRGRLVHVDSGWVRTKPSEPMGERLAEIHAMVHDAIGRHQPDQVSIEAIFRHKSSQSALKLGQARGVALLAAAQHGHLAHEYNPMTIKRAVGAHGRADKAAVARMVTILLGEPIDGPDDVTDALAIAITHCSHARAQASGFVR